MQGSCRCGKEDEGGMMVGLVFLIVCSLIFGYAFVFFHSRTLKKMELSYAKPIKKNQRSVGLLYLAAGCFSFSILGLHRLYIEGFNVLYLLRVIFFGLGGFLLLYKGLKRNK